MAHVGPCVQFSVAVLVALTHGSQTADDGLLHLGVKDEGHVVDLPVGLDGSGHEFSVHLLLTGARLADRLVLLGYVDSADGLNDLLQLVCLQGHVAHRRDVRPLGHCLSLDGDGVTPLVSIHEAHRPCPSSAERFKVLPEGTAMLQQGQVPVLVSQLFLAVRDAVGYGGLLILLSYQHSTKQKSVHCKNEHSNALLDFMFTPAASSVPER